MDTGVMGKSGFTELLTERGYTLEASTSGVPTVVCDTASIGKVSREIRKLAKEAGYSASFGVKGNSVLTEDAEPAAENTSFDVSGENDRDTSFDVPDNEAATPEESIIQEYEQLDLFQ